MTTQQDTARQFLALHHGDAPLLMPNPWDAGSARILASLGFAALATTSSGFAATLGRIDGSVTREEAIEHSAAIVAATDVPVSADLENGFAEQPDDVAETIALAIDAGLAGCSIEDSPGKGLYPFELAVARVKAAAERAHAGDVHLVLTARAENHIRGNPDLDDTISRLQAYQAAGADVLFAPGLADLEDIRRVVDSVELPVNVLARPNAPSVAQLAEIGVKRISVGGAFAYVGIGAVVNAARELLEKGTYNYWDVAAPGAAAARSAFTS
jgi:2-methylisocitrate lyase-like PEP mutase family enzyme